MTDRSIKVSFPTFPAAALTEILGDVGMTPDAAITELLSLGVTTSDVLIDIAEYIISHAPERQLQYFVPGLQEILQESIPLEALSARPANGLQRCGVSTWEDLVKLTPDDLLDMYAMGRKSVAEIIALALSRAAMQVFLSETNGHLRTDALSAPISWGDLRVLRTETRSSLLTMLHWATCIGNVNTLGAALELTKFLTPPSDVAEAIDVMHNTPLQLSVSLDSQITAAYSSLWEACGDARNREIFLRRIALEPPTLEELGNEMGLTRERVRQIQKVAHDNIAAAVAREECTEIRWRAAQLGQDLGTAISWSSDTTRDALRKACLGIDHKGAIAETIMLWVAGPYRLDKKTGWIFKDENYTRGEVGPQSELGPPVKSSFLQSVSDEGRIDIAAAKERATETGLVPAAVEEWLKLLPVRNIGGKVLLWIGNAADKAAAILGVRNAPSTAEELNEVIAEGHSVRGLRDRLLGDSRFVRADRSRFGLRKWGLEEYSGIVEEIEEEIQRCGGRAEIHSLVRTICERYNLRYSSVISYTAVPRFVVEGDYIHRRRPNEPFEPAKTLFEERHTFLISENRCSYRVPVNDDILRGSGRPLPQGVGAWLRVLPGERREYRLPNGEHLLVTWPDSALFGPALGSLRRQALARSAVPGDFLLLEFDRSTDEAMVLRVTGSDLETVSGWVRGTLLTGIDAGNKSEFEQLLAKAVGAASERELRARCRLRGDDELIELIRGQSSAELDAALERLKELL